MYQEEWRGEMLYNPYAVDHFTPKEEMMIRYIYLPILEFTGKDKETAIVKQWIDTGYIPHCQFPEHLNPFLKGKKEKKL